MTLEQQIDRKLKLIAKHESELRALRAKCTHEDTMEQKSWYFPGSYNDTAYTTYWSQCRLCGYKTKETVKDHGYYG